MRITLVFLLGLFAGALFGQSSDAFESAIEKNDLDLALTILSEKSSSPDAVEALALDYLKVANLYSLQRQPEVSQRVTTIVDELIEKHQLKSDTVDYLLDFTKGTALTAAYNPDGIPFLKKSLNAFLKNNYTDSISLARIYGNIGNTFYISYQNDSSKKYYNKLASLMQNEEVRDKLGVPCYWSLGLSYGAQGLSDSSIYSFDKVLSLIGKADEQNAYTHAAINTNKSGELRKVYRIEEAYDLMKANDVILTQFNLDPYNQQVINARFEYAMVELASKNYKNARRSLRKVWNIERQLSGDDHISNAYNAYTMGEIYYEEKQYDSAEYYLNKAYQVVEKQTTDFSYYLSNIDRKLGDVLLANGEYEASLESYHKGLNRILATESPSLFSLAAVNLSIANGFFESGSLDSAHYYVNQSFSYNIVEGYSSDTIPKRIQDVYSAPLLLQTIVLKIKLELGGNIQSDAIGQWAELFMTWRDAFDLDAKNDNDILQLISLQEDLIETLLASDLDQTFTLPIVFKLQEVNQNKKLIRELEFKNAKNSILDSYLKTKLTTVDQSLNYLSGQLEETADGFEEINTKVIGLKETRNVILDSLKLMNPKYYNVRFGSSNTIYEDAIARLKEDQALIRYVWIKERIWAIYLASENQGIVQLDWIDAEAQLSALISKTSEPSFNLSEVGMYDALASTAYEKLLRPLESFIQGKQLIIYPDKNLHYLPFEALVTSPNPNAKSYADLNYVLKKHSISYEYSALRTLLTQPTGNLKDELLLFSPVYEDIPLIWSDEEKQLIGQSESLEDYTSKEATIMNFTSELPKYGKAHFLGHAFIDDQTPLDSYLLFTTTDSSNAKLSVRDIYNLELNNELLVLSACETGIGDYVNGDGVVGLTQAFFYAGVQRLMMSLWKVNDKSTSMLMGSFYQNMDNENIGEAIRLSKLDLIAQNDGQFSHPYYWAGFIVIGDTELPRGNLGYMLMIGGVGLLLLVLMVSRRKRKA
ncbi:MAG: CHAT domain-containing tetratricopeptide repeat protein [Bacteroidota bacterium]